VATLDLCAHIVNVMTDVELISVLRVATGRIHGNDSRLVGAYQEVQIHGEVSLADHVALIMAHPAEGNTLQGQAALATLQSRGIRDVVWIEEDSRVDAQLPASSQQSNSVRSQVLRRDPDTIVEAGGGQDGIGNVVIERIKLPTNALLNGQQIDVEVPSGQLLRILVPHGAQPGCNLNVHYRPGYAEAHAVLVEAPLTQCASLSNLERWEVQCEDGWHPVQSLTLASIREAKAGGLNTTDLNNSKLKCSAFTAMFQVFVCCREVMLNSRSHKFRR